MITVRLFNLRNRGIIGVRGCVINGASFDAIMMPVDSSLPRYLSLIMGFGQTEEKRGRSVCGGRSGSYISRTHTRPQKLGAPSGLRGLHPTFFWQDWEWRHHCGCCAIRVGFNLQPSGVQWFFNSQMIVWDAWPATAYSKCLHHQVRDRLPK